jgi:hypothetical protein
LKHSRKEITTAALGRMPPISRRTLEGWEHNTAIRHSTPSTIECLKHQHPSLGITTTNIESPLLDSTKHQAYEHPGAGIGDEPPSENKRGNPSTGSINALEKDVSTCSTKLWSKRHKPTQRLIESRQQAVGIMMEIQQQFDNDQYDGEVEYDIQRQMADPIAFAASLDPGTMYLHEAMRQPDCEQFIKAMVKEVTTHTNGVTGKL